MSEVKRVYTPQEKGPETAAEKAVREALENEIAIEAAGGVDMTKEFDYQPEQLPLPINPVESNPVVGVPNKIGEGEFVIVPEASE